MSVKSYLEAGVDLLTIHNYSRRFSFLIIHSNPIRMQLTI